MTDPYSTAGTAPDESEQAEQVTDAHDLKPAVAVGRSPGTNVLVAEARSALVMRAAPRTVRGTPKTCAPLWTATTGDVVESSPAVVNGLVYVGSADAKLYAFDATGTINCSGTPKTCAPLWTGTTGGPVYWSSPAVANGMVTSPHSTTRSTRSTRREV